MATKTEDPSTSTHVVDTPIAEESSDDNDNVQGSQTEPVPFVPPVSEKSSKHVLLHGLHLMTFLVRNGKLDIKNLLLGLMCK